MSNETSPAVKLRENVVLLVVRAIIFLTTGLYLEIAVLLVLAKVQHEPLSTAVPTELWAAAAGGFGYISATLINTKHDATVQDPAPVQVMNQADDPVPVIDPEPEPEPVEEEPIPDEEPAPKRRR